MISVGGEGFSNGRSARRGPPKPSAACRGGCGHGKRAPLEGLSADGGMSDQSAGPGRSCVGGTRAVLGAVRSQRHRRPNLLLQGLSRVHTCAGTMRINAFRSFQRPARCSARPWHFYETDKTRAALPALAFASGLFPVRADRWAVCPHRLSLRVWVRGFWKERKVLIVGAWEICPLQYEQWDCVSWREGKVCVESTSLS